MNKTKFRSKSDYEAKARFYDFFYFVRPSLSFSLIVYGESRRHYYRKLLAFFRLLNREYRKKWDFLDRKKKKKNTKSIIDIDRETLIIITVRAAASSYTAWHTRANCKLINSSARDDHPPPCTLINSFARFTFPTD